MHLVLRAATLASHPACPRLRPGQHAVACGNGRHPARTLLRTRAAQRSRTQHHRRQERIERQRAAQRLHHEHHVDRAATETTIVLGVGQAEQADGWRPWPTALGRTLRARPHKRLPL